MPGIPSGRGCGACRTQKKKCNQARPSCSRCARLGISCTGSGEQRFKFVQFQSSESRTLTRLSTPPAAVHGIPPSPDNELTMTIGALCSALEVSDVRYDLSVYGGFLKDIPRRLGTNPALDASVNALTLAFPSLHSRQHSVKALECYIQALSALRECLNDPAEARSVNTLCAIHLITICQSWIGRSDDQISGQGEVITFLLSHTDFRQGKPDEFESELGVAMCIMVIVEALGNPRIQLPPSLIRLFSSRDTAISIQSLKLQNLAKLPEFMRSPERHLADIKEAYTWHKTDIPAAKNLLASTKSPSSLHSRFQIVYSVVLTYSIVLNILLRVFESDSVTLNEDSVYFVEEAIPLAEDAMQYRPLGSSAIPMCLTAAWAATNERETRIRIEAILEIYQTDFSMSKWTNIAYWLEQRLKGRSGVHGMPLEEMKAS